MTATVPTAVHTTTLATGVFEGIGPGAAAIVLYAAVGLTLLTLAFHVIDWTTPGPLRQYVRGGHPNAAILAGGGMVAMALVVVTAIWTSQGSLAAGLVHTVVYGVLGIVVQAAAARLFEIGLGINVGASLEREVYTSESLLLAAVHLALGVIVAVSII